MSGKAVSSRLSPEALDKSRFQEDGANLFQITYGNVPVSYTHLFLAVGCGALAVVAVILGNYQNNRQFHDAPLDALEIVSGAGDEQEHENVHHGCLLYTSPPRSAVVR